MAFINLSNKTSVGFSSVLVVALFMFMHGEGVPTNFVPTFSVDSAQNRTICPFIVTSNRNVTRWPEEIKEITCIQHTRHSCCNHRYECTQLQDTLVVYSADRSESWSQTFKVGCVCLEKDVATPIRAEKRKVDK